MELLAMTKQLTKAEVIARLEQTVICPERVRVTVVSYESNPMAPEPLAYKVTYSQFGTRYSTTLWPNTVGFQ